MIANGASRHGESAEGYGEAMVATANGNGDAARERHKLAFNYRIEGDLKFISHHDTLRMFRRVFARAALPVKLSQGFNPQPRMSIPLPRPVGIASNDETVVVELTKPVDPGEARCRLDEQMPVGAPMIGARTLPPGERLVPVSVVYRLELGPERPADLHARVRRLLDAEHIEVRRVSPKYREPRTIDLRAFVLEINLDDRGIEFLARVTDAGTARPAEIAGALGLAAGPINHLLRRMKIHWQSK